MYKHHILGDHLTHDIYTTGLTLQDGPRHKAVAEGWGAIAAGWMSVYLTMFDVCVSNINISICQDILHSCNMYVVVMLYCFTMFDFMWYPVSVTVVSYYIIICLSFFRICDYSTELLACLKSRKALDWWSSILLARPSQSQVKVL